MTRLFRTFRIVLPLMTVFTFLLVSGCESGTAGTPVAPESPPSDVVLPLEGDGAYVIIRPETISKDELAVITELRQRIADKTGVNPQIKDDFVREGTKFTASEREICIGMTNREESRRAYEGLRYRDYRIRLDGTRLVICYGSVEAEKEAVEKFMTEYVSEDEKAVKVPSDLDLEALREYKLDTISLAGHDVSEYVVAGEESFTSAVRDKIAEITGLTLKTSANVPKSGPVIMLGKLEDLAPEEAGVRLVDGNLVAGTNGEYYDNVSALPLLLRLLTETGGTLTEKDLNKKEKVTVEYRLPFKRGINTAHLESYPYSETDELNITPAAGENAVAAAMNPSAVTGWTYYLTLPDTFPELVRMGFDHIRLPVNLRRYYDEKTDSLITAGAYDISHLDSVIRSALDAGLYVLLDFHGWTMYTAATGQTGFNPSQKEYYDMFLKIWERVAEHYKDWDERLWFELINEPPVADKVNEVQHDALKLIRKTNPDRMVIMTIPDGSGTWQLDSFVPPDDDHYALAVHTYVPGEFTHQGATWADPTKTYQVRLTEEHLDKLRNDLSRIRAYMAKHPDIAIILNEFGVNQPYADPDDTTRWLREVVAFCEKYAIPWTYWNYCDWPSEKTVRAGFEAMGMDYSEANKFYDFGARLAYDTDWRHHILKGLGIE